MRTLSWAMLIAVLVAAVLTVGTAAFTYVTLRRIVAESPVQFPPPPQAGAQSTKVSLFSPTKTAAPAAATPLAPQVATAEAAVKLLPDGVATSAATEAVKSWNDPSRITILLLGIDQRKGEKGPFRTDTMMILSLDPIRKTGAMLSIPRDIYINIPSVNVPDRINNANAIGETQQYPGGGPALAVKAVQSLLGVPIQRYVMVNFDVFTTVIDAVGPITVCPKDAIHDDKYPDGSYGYIVADFPAGCQDLDSTKLLQYARVRHNAGDDFGRATRQQEVIRSVREKVLSLGGVSALLGKATTIWASLKDSIKTDLSFDDMVQLAQLAQSIPKDNIQSAVITDRDGYLQPSKLASGEEVFSPVYEKIHDLVEKLFDSEPVGPANSEATAEGATITVSNGSGVDGMAKNTADKLIAKGFNITDVKNADLQGGYGKTVIRVYSGKIKTARLIADALKLDGTAISDEPGAVSGVDIEVIVGKDLAPSP
ncbi:MAG: LCP family protein [Chloroflexota bacterium]